MGKFSLHKIDREIIRLSIPTVVSNITIPLLGICDTAIAGHLGSELFLSAIAVGSVMLNAVFWIFGFLRGGTTGLTANALGAGKKNEMSKVLYRALLIAATAGILLIIFQEPVFKFLWWVTGPGEEIRFSIYEYFSLRIWGSPALLAIIAVSGWFVGMQNTVYPMLIAILTNLINILSSFILVFPMEYGFRGVALGTLWSNWVGLGVAVVCVLLFLKGKILKCTLSNLLKGEWLRYFSVNGNLFLRSLFIICVTMGVTAAGAKLGPLTLAVNVIVMQFFQFFSFFMDGFAYSGEAMVGLRAGERNIAGLRACANRLLMWTFWTGLLFFFAYLVGTESIAALLTDSEAVIAGVSQLKILIALIPIVSCWAFIFDGFYVGITNTFKMMVSTLIGGIGFFTLILYAERVGFDSMAINGNHIIWIAFLFYLLSRGLYLAVYWNKSIGKVIQE